MFTAKEFQNVKVKISGAHLNRLRLLSAIDGKPEGEILSYLLEVGLEDLLDARLIAAGVLPSME